MSMSDFVFGTVGASIVYTILLLMMHDQEHKVRNAFLAIFFTNVLLIAFYFIVSYFMGVV